MTYDEYRKGINDLQKMDGWRLSRKMDRLSLTAHIFHTNHSELICRIEYFKSDEAMQLWGVRNRAQMDLFLKEITRLLHNFLASAMTLVEHTRILARELYKDADFWMEYESQIGKEFTSNALAQFIQDLRNYILHCDLPVAFASLTPECEQLLKLDMRLLRDWRGWKSLSRQYLTDANDEEQLEGMIQAYTHSITRFHDWFYDRQTELHKQAFHDAEELRERIVNSRWHYRVK